MSATPRLVRVTARTARLFASRATPFYAFDSTRARAIARRWKRAAEPAGIALVYPYKCNRHPELLDLLAAEGIGAEVASSMDLAEAIRRGIGGSRLILQGAAKDSDLLDAALAHGARIVADGPGDADAILARARHRGVPARYGLRFRSSAAAPSQSAFGFSPRELLSWTRAAVERKEPLPEGLAFHLGTGISSLHPYRTALREAGELARRLRGSSVAFAWLDAGGGFAAEGEARRDVLGRIRRAPPSPERILAALRASLRREMPGASLAIEPGRALASDAFGLITRVLRVRGRQVYVDASRMSHAFFVPNGRHPFLPIPRRSGGPPCEVAGPLGSGLDRLSARESIGRPREGDLLFIGSVGAYNLIASNAWSGRVAGVVEILAG